MKLKFSAVFALLAAAPAFSQDFALERLNTSPRHHEWIEIKREGKTVHSFVAYPEKSKNVPAVIVIHENQGLTDWVRSLADQLAEAGYLAIAPDLLSGFSAEYPRTSDFKQPNDARNAIYQLDPEQVTADLTAVQRYIEKAPGSNGKTAVIGFCWGGAQAFRFAADASKLEAALVFYGSAPDEAVIQRVSTPVYGFYGENDQRINAGIESTAKLMKKNKKIYAYEIYKGAGHAFMKHGDDPQGSPENKQARDDSWLRIKKILP